MGLGDRLRGRVLELERRAPGIRVRLAQIAEGATLRAVETATELTPPNTFGDGEIRGVNMITGSLARHWASDSRTKPTETASRFVTELRNDMQYASYVNDGHRLDKHFVPGLYVDPTTGLLSRDLSRKVGLVVGTKTTYLEGLHMTDKAKETYEEVADRELDKLTREVLGP